MAKNLLNSALSTTKRKVVTNAVLCGIGTAGAGAGMINSFIKVVKTKKGDKKGFIINSTLSVVQGVATGVLLKDTVDSVKTVRALNIVADNDTIDQVVNGMASAFSKVAEDVVGKASDSFDDEEDDDTDVD